MLKVDDDEQATPIPRSLREPRMRCVMLELLGAAVPRLPCI